MTIVSTISSATEIICALGLQKNLIGISHECDYPPEIKGLPIVSEPKINPALAGKEIHQALIDIVRDGLSVYRIKTDVLTKLQPDLIVTQDQCAVCAVSLKEVEKAVQSLTLKETKICSLNPYTLKEISDTFLQVAEATHVREAGTRLVERFQKQLKDVETEAKNATHKPTVVCLEWLEPPMVAGGWIPELVLLAGGIPLMVKAREHFKKIRWEELEIANPDIVVILPCGYPIEKTLQDLEDPALRSSLKKLHAKCFVCDGNAYFNRPGPRIADSAEILAAIFHPDQCIEWRKKYDIRKLSRNFG